VPPGYSELYARVSPINNLNITGVRIHQFNTFCDHELNKHGNSYLLNKLSKDCKPINGKEFKWDLT
jgi:hypothetical protein